MKLCAFPLFLSAAASAAGDQPKEELTVTTLDSIPAVTPAADDFHKKLSNLPHCPGAERTVEHLDSACDRVALNSPENRLARAMGHSAMSGYDDANNIPDEKTWVCPADDGIGDAEGSADSFKSGHRQQWIVRNSSSGPVVLAWVNKARNNLEVSPFASKASPPHTDPEAILKPGEWTSINAVQGHVFHVRELKSIGGELVAGRILLRHRLGMITVENKYGGKFKCPPEALVDPNPATRNVEKRLKDAFKSEPWNPNEYCNVIHVAFKNLVGCPVDLYYAGVDSNPQNQASGNNNGTSTYQSTGCREMYKMHLGLNPSPRSSIDWDSPVKFQGTYLNHRFVARLHHDPSIVVDDIMITNSIINDCPDDGNVGVGIAGVGFGAALNVGLNVGHVDTFPYLNVYQTNITASLGALLNSTTKKTKATKRVPTSSTASTLETKIGDRVADEEVALLSTSMST